MQQATTPTLAQSLWLFSDETLTTMWHESEAYCLDAETLEDSNAIEIRRALVEQMGMRSLSPFDAETQRVLDEAVAEVSAQL